MVDPVAEESQNTCLQGQRELLRCCLPHKPSHMSGIKCPPKTPPAETACLCILSSVPHLLFAQQQLWVTGDLSLIGFEASQLSKSSSVGDNNQDLSHCQSTQRQSKQPALMGAHL